jgi:hypothetical protein
MREFTRQLHVQCGFHCTLQCDHTVTEDPFTVNNDDECHRLTMTMSDINDNRLCVCQVIGVTVSVTPIT